MLLRKCLLLLLAGVASAAVLPRAEKQCPYHIPENQQLVDDEYIVMLKPGHTLEQHFENIGADLAREASMFHPIRAINGYRALLDRHTVHELVRYDPGVRSVHHDHFALEAEDDVSNEAREVLSEKPEVYEATAAEKHDDGLDRRDSPGGWTFHTLEWYYHMKMMTDRLKQHNLDRNTISSYHVMTGAGYDVDIYVLDSGVRISHDAFGGRAKHFLNAATSKYCNSSTNDDLDGHGTHVAGLAGGRYSLAPSSNIINVKVKCGSRSSEKCVARNGGLAQAVSDVVDEHQKNKEKSGGWYRGAVINISAGDFSQNEPLEYAIAYASAEGIPIAAAAGNGGTDKVAAPCSYAQYGWVLCVGAVDPNYKKPAFSNYGRSVSLWAPGEDVKSAGIGSDSSWVSRSGTSMATPCLAGWMATIVGYERLYWNTRSVYYRVIQNAIEGVVDVPQGSADYFLNWDLDYPGKSLKDPYIGVGEIVDDVLPLAASKELGPVNAVNLAAVDKPPASPAAAEPPRVISTARGDIQTQITFTLDRGLKTDYTATLSGLPEVGYKLSWTGKQDIDTARFDEDGGDFEDIFTETSEGFVTFATSIKGLLPTTATKPADVPAPAPAKATAPAPAPAKTTAKPAAPKKTTTTA